ncbi:MAG: glycosyltransferase family 1 protein [Solirubrobacteraceae bacterium]|nr:glycosyltransferase family 1 protein [Patulibacter sp.]
MTRPRVGIDARHAGRGLGIATFEIELARALAAAGAADVVWLGSPDAAPAGLEAHPLAGPYPRLDLVDGERVVRRHRLDAILFAGNTGPTRALSVPSVLTVHDLLFFDEPRPTKLRPLVGHTYERWIVPRAIRAATAVTTVSETSAAALRSLVPGRDVIVIPHGMTTRAGAGEPVAEGAIVAFAGRDGRKRTDLVLAAYEALPAPRPPLVLFASAGIPDALTERVDRLVAAPDVHVIRGHATREQVDATLAAGLALVYCAEREGFGFPVLEGMAAGVPVITGLAPSTREVAGDAALLIDAQRPAESITAALTRLAAEPGLADQLRTRGLAHAAGFTWARAAERYTAVLDGLLGRAG